MNKLLVVYYSKTNSTKEVAERIAAVLEAQGQSVDLITVDQMPQWEAYSGVILGAPINGFQWVPEMTQFVQKHQAALNERPVAVFCLTYVWGAGGGFVKKMIQKNFQKAVLPIAPKSQMLFGGKIPSPMPGLIQFLFGIPKDAPLDARDWKQVEAWSHTLKTTLG